MKPIKLIKADRQSTSTWAGGTTTQIYIYPENASYPQRDFAWRLSTAKVELEESSFTRLEGYDRLLMVLEGELKLVHKEHHSIQLSRFEQDSFKGGWDTASYGQARDFNLMVKEGIKGSLESIRLAQGDFVTKEWKAENHKGFYYGLYCYEGTAIFEGTEEVVIEAGDLLLLADQDQIDYKLKNAGMETSSLIAAIIEL